MQKMRATKPIPHFAAFNYETLRDELFGPYHPGQIIHVPDRSAEILEARGMAKYMR